MGKHSENILEDLLSHFDTQFYISQNPDVLICDIDPLSHYMQQGWKEGRNPSQVFFTDFYLERNPDVAQANVNPFEHYVKYGITEGRVSRPVPDDLIANDDTPLTVELPTLEAQGAADFVHELELLRPHFDPEFYAEQSPDLASGGADLLHHFYSEGWINGLDPSREFSVSTYLDQHRDVADAGVNPLWHYLVAGKDEGRSVWRSLAGSGLDHEGVGPAEIEAVRPYFDSVFYVTMHPDAAGTEMDPIEHYCKEGWRSGLDPHDAFSTSYYLESNPDVAALQINPFWHYIVAGKNEGRAPQRPGGYLAERLRHTTTLEEDALHWRASHEPDQLLSASSLKELIRKGCAGQRKGLILSIGHDNYRKISGGVQMCEQREESVAISEGMSYLNIYPWQPLPRLGRLSEDDDPVMGLLLNGRDVGACNISEMISAISSMRREFGEIQVVIHHLLGHVLERIVELVEAAGRNECWLWLHDFFTICPSYTLQRNGISYCGAPSVDSNACGLCKYGAERHSHSRQVSALFDHLAVHVVAPSEITAEIWQQRSGLRPASLQVHPHMTLEWLPRRTPLPAVDCRKTIAFIGTRAAHKGWDIFESLVRALTTSGEYRFVYFGVGNSPAMGIEHRHVHVTDKDPDAMIDAIREENVDLILHWTTWPETFSLSTFEAYAGGAYVVTNEVSGNVAATVRKLKRGAVLENVADLKAFFTDGRAEDMIRTQRAEKRRFDVGHRLSEMSHGVIGLRARGDS